MNEPGRRKSLMILKFCQFHGYPKIDSSSEGGSLIQDSKGDDYLYVAVGKELKESKSMVIWALHNSGGKKIGILHVHIPSQVTTHHETERQEMLKALDEYVQLCASAGMTTHKLVIEARSIENGIILLVSQNMIARLVMGTAVDNKNKRGVKEIKSAKSKHVNKHAPGYCQIQFVCNNVVVYTREATSPVVESPDLASSPDDISLVVDAKNRGFYQIPTEKIEVLEKENAKLSKELQDARYKYFALDTKRVKSDLTAKELEEKLASAMQLVESYKKTRDDIQRERDNAINFCLDFPSQEIQTATYSFNPSLKTGEDAYGNTYKGVLRRTKVAIKIPHSDNPSIPQAFQEQVEILCKLRHPNIANLVGVCTESHALIYEQCANLSLEDRLNDKDQGSPFPWQIRVKIATELHNVLAFLHAHKPNPVIHGDLRPENIHLDSNYTCKLNGFKTSESEVRSYPYMDPEFFAGGDLTTRSDVYALGVILLRLLTGKPAMRLARQVQSDGLSDLLDTSAGWPLDLARQLAGLALRCCEMSRDRRPDLDDVVWRVLHSM